MTVTISFFNNKGGVGKTTFLFHIAHRVAELGKTVLMVDCDSQCNLTSYSLSESAIDQAWKPDGNSIYRQIEPVYKTTGDIRNRAATHLGGRLHIIPGDLSLSEFEDRLGDSWNSAKGGDEAALRAQSAIHRVIRQAAEKAKADVVLLDLGPNLGATNRAVLAGSDYLISPVSPDLFSIRGTENLGNKLVTWRREWDQCLGAWRGNGLDIPKGKPKFIGYVTQQHNLRNNSAGMTKGWQIFGNQVEQAIQTNIVSKLTSLNQVVTAPSYNLGMIPNLHSLVPYSQDARKPVFHCTSSDGLKGAHIASARDSRRLFDPVADIIVSMA
ncbi:ParA family protein [Ectopseudomonas oleovorans]|jgi:cellulose biosynthesis protein BcsQ|uniref:ParA family protein n=1 Tax=Ectopseudomonas oleovorans TaxID=301 RepID=UPI000CF01DD6|nr:ParA family protein [Pseudomonas oleovorans]PPV39398.1 cobyrinic acid a,c-diamide synthase [Pseudomonas oleovorans]